MSSKNLQCLRRDVGTLNMECEVRKENHGALRKEKPMRCAFIRAEDEQKTFPVRPRHRALEVSTSGYYAWLQRKPSKRSKRDAELSKKVRASAPHGALTGAFA